MKKISLIFMIVQMGFLVRAETQNTDVEYRPDTCGYKLYKKVWTYEQNIPYIITIAGDTLSTSLLNVSLNNPLSLIPVARTTQPIKRLDYVVIPYTKIRVETQYLKNGKLLPIEVSHEKDRTGGYVKILTSLIVSLLIILGSLIMPADPKRPDYWGKKSAKILFVSAGIVFICTLLTPPFYIVSTIFWTLLGIPIILLVLALLSI